MILEVEKGALNRNDFRNAMFCLLQDSNVVYNSHVVFYQCVLLIYIKKNNKRTLESKYSKPEA